ncbi:helix-turn-helix transcriptional regulator [Pseudonocardia sp. GCM10023141]|uniref:helix-turn-helix transcriptional regulator n=1 Tax=Pseudonocardia sp. GCM10023141 TaxID=3252653 RepID=UPI00360FA680
MTAAAVNAAMTAAVVRIRRLCEQPESERVLRAEVLREIRAVVPFDFYVWVGTDPVTRVGATPLAEVPSPADLPLVIRLKYATAALRWTGLPADRVLTLAGWRGPEPGDRPAADLPWRDLLNGYGVHDVASVVLRDRFGCWGFIDLWRSATGPAFTPAEQGFLAGLLPILTRAVRRSVGATFHRGAPATAGPAVLLLAESLAPQSFTPQADVRLRALLPTPPEHSPVPAIALNVAAQLLAVEGGVDDRPAMTRGYAGGRWLIVRAARLGPAGGPARDIVVTLEDATTADRLEVYRRAIGLTARETDVLGRLVDGADTRSTARALGIVEVTVNDHLKSIFAKSGTNSRRELIARLTG